MSAAATGTRPAPILLAGRRAAQAGRPLGWWGMVMLIATEATLFGLLLFSYFFIRANSAQWPLGDIDEPELFKSGIRTVILLTSSIPVHVADMGIRKGRRGLLHAGLMLALLMAAVFLAGHAEEYHKIWKEFRPGDNAYASLFYTITSFHAVHLFVGMVMLSVVLGRSLQGRISEQRHLPVQLTSMYWHFVDVVWIAVYSSLYLSVTWL